MGFAIKAMEVYLVLFGRHERSELHQSTQLMIHAAPPSFETVMLQACGLILAGEDICTQSLGDYGLIPEQI